MNNFISKLKLKYKINIVFYISIFSIVTLALASYVISNKINNDLLDNAKHLQKIKNYYENINKDLKNLNYLTIENSIDQNIHYNYESIYKNILLNIENLKNDNFLQNQKDIVIIIDEMKDTISGYKTIVQNFKQRDTSNTQENLYYILTLTLNSSEIYNKLAKVDSLIVKISQKNYNKLNQYVLNASIFMTIYILSIALFMIYINNRVVFCIIKQLKNLQYGIVSFFDLLSQQRDDITYLDTSTNDEISNIAKIINENMNAGKNLIFTQRETTKQIQKKVKEATFEIQNLNNELEDTQREVILTLSIIGEERSNETGYHVMRVAEYSLILARLSGLSLEESMLVKIASPMHDIGKIGIPDAILNKPGGYTQDEFEIMKKHPSIGYRMLKHSDKPILKAASHICYEHHEKWDGSGYPRGLKGEDIHIYGRITAIADVFDALGSDRVYKKAWELKDIYDLFEKEKGKHFDPNLVELFLDNLEYFIAARENIESKDEEASLSDFITNFDKVDDII